jgi:3-hydroxyacyl-CoA dehydrogenase
MSGSIGLLCITNPPVNAISPTVVNHLKEALDSFERDATAKALVIYCEGRTFVAGGDITSFDAQDFTVRPFNEQLARIESESRPVVAALHGTVLGGGLELAMSCHHRVAQEDTRLGLPEIKLGLLPGSLGTQRLPRLVGVPLALDLMMSGRSIGARQALAAGLIDETAEGNPLTFGIAVAERLVSSSAIPRRTSGLVVKADAAATAALEAAAAQAAKNPGFPALSSVVRAVEASIKLSFAGGEEVEAREFEQLRQSGASRAMRHLFFAERAAAHVPGLSSTHMARRIESVGIVGAGTMGGGIAMSFANAGIPVVLVEASEAALQRGLALVRKNYDVSAVKGRLSAQQVADRMSLLTGSLDYASLSNCDLVIEAVFEDMQLKKEICARLGAICKPGAIIATNTSTLNVDDIAEASGRPGDIVGMHFFSPANVMRMLEVVRGAKTSPDVLASAMQVARRIGKVAVVSGVCYGFIGNRMLEPYMREAEFLLLEGAEPRQIDAAIESFGMAMGPCRMFDLAGLDIGARVVSARLESGELPPDKTYRLVVRKLVEQGRHGQKTQAGYYRYDGRTPQHDPAVTQLCIEQAKEYDIPRRAGITDQEIVERLLYPLINEGIRILEEGIAFRPGDIDVMWTNGYGFPQYRGGPMFMADEVGLSTIFDRLENYGRLRGNQFGYWTPSEALKTLALRGQRLRTWPSAQ